VRGEPTFDSLTQLDRDIVGSTAGRLNIPLYDSVRTVGALKLEVRELERLVMNVEKMPDGRAQLFAIGASVRALNQKINAFRLKGKRPL